MTPTEDERTPIVELDARQAAYRKHRADFQLDHENYPKVAADVFFDGWDAAAEFFRRPVQGEPSHEGHSFCDPRLGCVQGEPEWEYTWAGHDGEDDWVLDETFATHSEAVKFIRTQGWVLRQGGSLHRRRAAGPWLPVTNTESEKP